MIVGHHGFGEELVLYAVAGGGGAGSALLVFRVEISRWVRRLRRRAAPELPS
jgi:hypothetical protein